MGVAATKPVAPANTSTPAIAPNQDLPWWRINKHFSDDRSVPNSEKWTVGNYATLGLRRLFRKGANANSGAANAAAAQKALANAAAAQKALANAAAAQKALANAAAAQKAAAEKAILNANPPANVAVAKPMNAPAPGPAPGPAPAAVGGRRKKASRGKKASKKRRSSSRRSSRR